MYCQPNLLAHALTWGNSKPQGICLGIESKWLGHFCGLGLMLLNNRGGKEMKKKSNMSAVWQERSIVPERSRKVKVKESPWFLGANCMPGLRIHVYLFVFIINFFWCLTSQEFVFVTSNQRNSKWSNSSTQKLQLINYKCKRRWRYKWLSLPNTHFWHLRIYALDWITLGYYLP